MVRRPSLQIEVSELGPGQGPEALRSLRRGAYVTAGPKYPTSTMMSYIAHFVEVRIAADHAASTSSTCVSIADCGRLISQWSARHPPLPTPSSTRSVAGFATFRSGSSIFSNPARLDLPRPRGARRRGALLGQPQRASRFEKWRSSVRLPRVTGMECVSRRLGLQLCYKPRQHSRRAGNNRDIRTLASPHQPFERWPNQDERMSRCILGSAPTAPGRTAALVPIVDAPAATPLVGASAAARPAAAWPFRRPPRRRTPASHTPPHKF